MVVSGRLENYFTRQKTLRICVRTGTAFLIRNTLAERNFAASASSIRCRAKHKYNCSQMESTNERAILAGAPACEQSIPSSLRASVGSHPPGGDYGGRKGHAA